MTAGNQGTGNYYSSAGAWVGIDGAFQTQCETMWMIGITFDYLDSWGTTTYSRQ
jgi:hypothetical protein